MKLRDLVLIFLVAFLACLAAIIFFDGSGVLMMKRRIDKQLGERDLDTPRTVSHKETVLS